MNKLTISALSFLLLGASACMHNNEKYINISKKSHIQVSMMKEPKSANDFETDFLNVIKEYKSHNAGKALGITEGKDIVVAIGNTGSGKSTLLNLLVGHDLKPHKHCYIVEEKNNFNSFLVGHSFQSTTVFPQYIEKDNTIL